MVYYFNTKNADYWSYTRRWNLSQQLHLLTVKQILLLTSVFFNCYLFNFIWYINVFVVFFSKWENITPFLINSSVPKWCKKTSKLFFLQNCIQFLLGHFANAGIIFVWILFKVNKQDVFFIIYDSSQSLFSVVFRTTYFYVLVFLTCFTWQRIMLTWTFSYYLRFLVGLLLSSP